MIEFLSTKNKEVKVNKLLKLALACALAGYCVVGQAVVTVPEITDLKTLSPESRHDAACPRISNYFTRAHYKIIDVNDEFAAKVIDRLISYLDYNHSLYTKAEIDDMYAHKGKIIDAIKKCDLRYPFAVYNDSMKKRFEKYKFFKDTVSADIDLSADDYIEIDRSKAEFPATEAELKKLWLIELKNEFETMHLNGKSLEETAKRLKRRYEVALSRLVKQTNDDVFSLFENSFATAIDPHTNYFGPVESENFNSDMNLSLEGIGAVLFQEDEYTVIQEILPGSPAEKSKKLKPKDKIIGVSQGGKKFEDVLGWRLTDVVDKIKGKKGTKVVLEIERGEGAATKSFNVELIRDKIRLQDKEAKSKIYNSYDGKKIGVVSISSFYTDLHSNVKRELNKLKSENAVIVDLRNNGGGLLPEAIYTTGLFIKTGPVVQVRDMNANEAPYVDEDESIEYSGPLVVLINSLSASSSEIMAAALQDYGRAILVGDTSFGKGTVQQSRPLTRLYDLVGSDLGSIHYTIAKFYRINGGSTQLKGVTPDIVIPTMVDPSSISERKQPNALNWDKINPASYNRYSDVSRYLRKLTVKHEERIKDDPVAAIIPNEQVRYEKLKEGKTIPVNFEKRKLIFDEESAFELANTNIRLKAMGKDPVKSVKDLPEDFEFDDSVLLETVNIASDYASMLKDDGVNFADHQD